MKLLPAIFDVTVTVRVKAINSREAENMVGRQLVALAITELIFGHQIEGVTLVEKAKR